MTQEDVKIRNRIIFYRYYHPTMIVRVLYLFIDEWPGWWMFVIGYTTECHMDIAHSNCFYYSSYCYCYCILMTGCGLFANTVQNVGFSTHIDSGIEKPILSLKYYLVVGTVRGGQMRSIHLYSRNCTFRYRVEETLDRFKIFGVWWE